ncbi:hypothetical protein MPLSOD_270024 [Mesorhizobium sp. SOD10]|nr:hypothetical protein MPLSOD_270024 [Mesorhizobium sp. SOD10]
MQGRNAAFQIADVRDHLVAEFTDAILCDVSIAPALPEGAQTFTAGVSSAGRSFGQKLGSRLYRRRRRFGFYVVQSVNDEHTFLGRDGVGQVVDITVKMQKSAAPAPTDLFASHCSPEGGEKTITWNRSGV